MPSGFLNALATPIKLYQRKLTQFGLREIEFGRVNEPRIRKQKPNDGEFIPGFGA